MFTSLRGATWSARAPSRSRTFCSSQAAQSKSTRSQWASSRCTLLARTQSSRISAHIASSVWCQVLQLLTDTRRATCSPNMRSTEEQAWRIETHQRSKRQVSTTLCCLNAKTVFQTTHRVITCTSTALFQSETLRRQQARLRRKTWIAQVISNSSCSKSSSSLSNF